MKALAEALTRILRLQSFDKNFRISFRSENFSCRVLPKKFRRVAFKRKNWNCWRYLMRVTRIKNEKIFAGFSPCSGIYASHRVSFAKACFSRNFVKVFVREIQNNLEAINFKMNKTKSQSIWEEVHLINSSLLGSCEFLSSNLSLFFNQPAKTSGFFTKLFFHWNFNKTPVIRVYYASLHLVSLSKMFSMKKVFTKSSFSGFQWSRSIKIYFS